MTKYKYNYKKFSLLLDADQPEDQELIKWLENHKTKRNNYSVQLRKALEMFIGFEGEDSASP